nr:odorant receptor 53 [Myzus persicae]
MDIWDQKNHVFNVRLAKVTGLFQILDPRTTKFRGRNLYHIVMAIIMLYVCVISVILAISSLYYWPYSIIVSVDYGWKGLMTLFLVHKMWNVVYHSNGIWNCLSITRYDFTSHSLRNRHVLDSWRDRSVRITTIMTVAYSTSSIVFAASSLIFRDDIMTVKNPNGSVGNYRQNLFNLYLIVTDQTYNAHYDTFYIVEVLYTVFLSILFFMFDFILVTLCLAVTCQMQMVNVSFESAGHKSVYDPTIDNTDEKICLSNEHDLIYDELISIIMDHQAVMKKYGELLTLFKPLMVLQVFWSSLSLIMVWFSFIMSFFGQDRFVASEVTTIKLICLIPSISFQIFLVCSLFTNLHNQKDSIIFALYSSNWTEMNIKCRKLILLTMRMNNTNQKKLKFTGTKIVNLELFYKIMSHCYSVVSVLINCIKAKNE